MLTTLPTHTTLLSHKPKPLLDLFSDPKRFESHHIETSRLLLDYSKTHLTPTLTEALCSLAKEAKVEEKRDEMFKGGYMNTTENRQVLHTALRTPLEKQKVPYGAEIQSVLDQMRSFVEAVHSGKHVGYTGKTITDIINIGIGGSDLGPVMVTQALQHYAKKNINIHFVSNIDATHIVE
jgi:glucose-6-phosphate isomerase